MLQGISQNWRQVYNNLACYRCQWPRFNPSFLGLNTWVRRNYDRANSPSLNLPALQKLIRTLRVCLRMKFILINTIITSWSLFNFWTSRFWTKYCFIKRIFALLYYIGASKKLTKILFIIKKIMIFLNISLSLTE